jgi:homotetrameric cytidine deaminase
MILLAVVLLLLLLAGILSGTETVLQRLSLVRALRLDEEQVDGAPGLLWLLEHRNRGLNVVLVLTVTVRVAAAALATLYAVDQLGEVPGVAAAIAVLVVASLVISEVAPRTYTLRHLEAAGLRLGPVMAVVVRAVDPVARLFVDLGRLVVRTRKEVSGPFPSEDELDDLLADEDEDEEIEDDERAMIHSIFELGDTVVREIMVPRPDMITVDESAALRDVVNRIIEHGYSRIPVHRENKDDIIGVVYAKDVMRRLAMQPGSGMWQDLIRDAAFIPETKRIDELLRWLQEQAVHQAIVVDEYGAMTGLVTIEDILEEIVGEIVDEHDREDPLVEVLEDERLRVDARLPVDDLNELMSAELPDDEWDTVGGLVFGMLGRVPEEGESVDIGGLTIVAERVQGPSHEGDAYDEADLLRQARAARERAYAPYSNFRVGCAVVSESGRIHLGANVENAAYPLSACAEQTTIRAMVASGDRGPIVAVAVVGDGEDPCTPCGACRQTSSSSSGPTPRSRERGRWPAADHHITELLPHGFGPMRLAQGR